MGTKKFQLIEHYLPLDKKIVKGIFVKKEDAVWFKKSYYKNERHQMSKFIIETVYV